MSPAVTKPPSPRLADRPGGVRRRPHVPRFITASPLRVWPPCWDSLSPKPTAYSPLPPPDVPPPPATRPGCPRPPRGYCRIFSGRLWRGGPLLPFRSMPRSSFSALLCYNIAKELKRMIRHMIFWNLAEENADRGRNRALSQETFAAMVGAVPACARPTSALTRGLEPTA